MSQHQLKTVVVKVGGDIAASSDQLSMLVQEIQTLHGNGHRIVLVHGGGPQATALTRRLGIEPQMVGGRRVTSEAVLEVVKMTLAGQVNVDLAAAFRAAALPALGLSGVSAGIVNAVKRPARIMTGCGPEPVDFGEVGDIVSINGGILQALVDAGFIPVMNSLGSSTNGRVLNINADVVACDVAIAIEADALVLVTGADGVYVDLDVPESRFSGLSISEARQLIDDGVVQGGMIPKLVESFRVIQHGVSQVNILAAGREQPIQAAVAGSREFGTTLYA